MSSDLIRLMQALFRPGAESAQPSCWQPATDICRTPRGWLVKYDLAGVRPEDVQLSVRGSWLGIRGARRDWCLEEGHCYYRMEIGYSQFERTIELPCDLEEARISSEFRHGLLLVRIDLEARP